jgi:hypothetical protein
VAGGPHRAPHLGLAGGRGGCRPVVALFVPAIHFEAQVEKTALSVMLLAAALDAFPRRHARRDRPRRRRHGSLVLARGNALAFVPLAALVLLLGWDRDRGDPLSATTGKRGRRAGSFSPRPCR